MPILARHGIAWMADPWYRRAWIAAPQMFAVVLVGLMFVAPRAPSPPSVAATWVHPADFKSKLNTLAMLRNEAKTSSAAEASLLRLAESGDAAAQFFVGNSLDPTLDRAKASPERTRKALEWYRKAARQGMALAQADTGFLLAHPQVGLSVDYAEAFSWLEEAAPKVPMAQRELGILYRQGRGVPVDTAKGIDLIRTAADHGDPVAQTILADAFDHGSDGLAIDHHEAVLYFQRAALQNNAFAQRSLAIHLRSGEGVASNQDQAAAWFKRAATNGDAYAKAQLSEAGSLPRVTPFSFSPIK